MSQLRKENIECPHCHQEGEFDLWTSVNVDLNPELREKVFSNELFMYCCPHCGKVTGVPAGTLYHDMTHGFMIFFDFFKPFVDKRADRIIDKLDRILKQQ